MQIRVPRRPRRASAGFALLEVMIAILIFSFGILELVHLQSVMTRAQGSAKFRADAVNLAEDLVGRIWADRPNFTMYDQATCASHPLCQDWMAKVGRTLPQGDAEITINAAGELHVKLTWSHSAEGQHAYEMETTVAF